MASKGVNKAILIGNLGADPDTRYTAGGTAVTNVNLATSDTWRDKSSGEMKERTEWHRVVFFARLADVFDNEVPDEWRVDLFELIRQTPNLDWLLLTKRVGATASRLGDAAVEAHDQENYDLHDWLRLWIDCNEPPENIWLGATVVNQAEADRDVPKLLATPAAVRFVSIEPMLGAINLCRVRCPPDRNDPDQIAWNFDALSTGSSVDFYNDGYWCDGDGPERATAIDWVIAGGESGPQARPSHPDWFRSLRDQCANAGVSFLFKQWGEWVSVSEVAGPGVIHEFPDHVCVRRVGKKNAGRDLDGQTWDQLPLERQQ